MRLVRVVIVAVLTLSVGGSAVAGDLKDSIAAAVQQSAAPPPVMKGNRAATLGGAALFATGMVVGLNAFINNKNGQFSEFGEADAVNKKLGAAGIGMAFAGGMVMFLGNRASHLPSVTFHKSGLSLGKRLSW